MSDARDSRIAPAFGHGPSLVEGGGKPCEARAPMQSCRRQCPCVDSGWFGRALRSRVAPA
jgi:hypothetical protein